MLRVAGPQQGVETTFVDMSYERGQGEDDVIVEETDAETRSKEDLVVYQRVKRAIRPNTKVSRSCFGFNPRGRL